MSPIRLEIVTAERLVFSQDIDFLLAPGVQGQIGILPHHIPLLSILEPGEMVVRSGEEEFSLAISGGFLEVRPDRIIVLADSAERDDEIDLNRAEEARTRAQTRMSHRSSDIDMSRAEAALSRSMARIKVAQKKRQQRGDTPRV